MVSRDSYLSTSGRKRAKNSLLAKATVELINNGEAVDVAVRRLQELWNLLETLI
jgi:hypothetical protein